MSFREYLSTVLSAFALGFALAFAAIHQGCWRSPTTSAEPRNVKWTPAGEAILVDDVVVQIKKVVLGRVSFERSETTTNEELLAIHLLISNASHTKKLDHVAWAPFVASDRDAISLSDEFGNKYRCRSFGLGEMVDGATRFIEPIYPGASVRDVVVFEPPVARAETLRLELPAMNFGGKGSIRFEIATKSIEKN